MQRQHGSNDPTQIHNSHLVVDTNSERLACRTIITEIGQQVYNVLQLIDDLVVHWQFPLTDRIEVIADLEQAGVKAFKRGQLGADAG